MPVKLDHDYINYLADKWRDCLLKKDPHDPVRKARHLDVLEMISEMKQETMIGKMLYNFFDKFHAQADEEKEAYQKYREGGSV